MSFRLRNTAIVGAIVSALLFGTPSVAHATKVAHRKTTTYAYACSYSGTKGVDETLKAIGKFSTSTLREQGWTGTVATWLPGTVNRKYVVGKVPMSPVPTMASCPPAVGAPVVQPAGTSDFSTSTEMIFVDFPLNQVPADAGFEYFIDGVSLGGNFIGYAYPGRGTHVLTLKVGGVVVDTDTFVIPPPLSDFSGTSDYSASSTSILFVDYPVGRTPANAPFEYIIDGDLTNPFSGEGRHLGENFVGNVESLGTAKHTLALWVGGVLVDVDQFQLGVG